METIMDFDNTATSFTDQFTKEYNQAKKKGFVGTESEYIQYRDFT